MSIRKSMKPFAVTAIAATAALFGIQAVAQTQSGQRTPGQTPMQTTTPAQTPGQSASPSGDFEQLDVNKDGAIDKKEAARQSGLSAVFDKADLNRDAKLDRTEFDAASKMTK